MKKFIITYCLLILFLTGTNFAYAKREKPIILFNKNPITQDNVAEFCDTFNRGERIHYLITTPKKIRSRFMYIQIVKMGKLERLGYDLAYGETVRLKDEQQFYYTDYIVLNDSGTYVMKVYTKDNPRKVYAIAQFLVK